MAKRDHETRPVAAPDTPASASPGDTARAVISIFLFVHLFVLFVCLTANLVPSSLQQRLLRVFRPYAQLLNFDLDGTRYFLTHATIRDVDHRLEVLASGESESADESWENIARGRRGSERFHRYQRLADTLSFFQDDERTTALLAESVARCYRSPAGSTITQLRCRRHTLQSWETPDSAAASPSDPDSPSYFSVVYRANILTTPAGAIRIVKRAEASLEAPPDRRADGSVRPAEGRAGGGSGQPGTGNVNSDQDP